MINDSKNLSPAHLLDPSPEQIRSWANAAAELMAEYLGTIRNRPVYPHTSSRQIREHLDSSLPEEPVNFDELLHIFRDTLIELSRTMFPAGNGVSDNNDRHEPLTSGCASAAYAAPAPINFEKLRRERVGFIIAVLLRGIEPTFL